MIIPLTPELLLKAYRQGLFPMADSRDDVEVNWVCPKMRGQLSISKLHMSKSLLRTLKQRPFDIAVNSDFRGVIESCAAQTSDRPQTWINDDIIEVFCDLHEHGFSHSVECYDGDALVGGIYGLAMGGAFFGESMFSRASNASKVALIHLTARLWMGGFDIFDTQFVNDHLKQFGVYEIPYDDYLTTLHEALVKRTDFDLHGHLHDDVLRAYLEFRGV